MEYPVSLSALLASTGLKYRWINIGRGIRSINNERFESIEEATSVYPWPLHYQAQFALIVWNPSQDQQHTIWFFQLPLDEQGLIIPLARDALIAELLTMLGITTSSQPTQSHGSQYTFEPDDEQKAAIHAKVSNMLAEPPSSWYQPVVDYLSNKDSGISWSSLGVQGFADIVERVSEKKIGLLLSNAIGWVEPPVFEVICRFLQNKKIPTILANAITSRIQRALTNETETLPDHFFSSGTSALAQAESNDNLYLYYQSILSSPHGKSPLILQQIGLRCWAVLKQDVLMKLYLDNLAGIPDSQALFNQQLADLMFVPDMRPLVLAQFRNPERSEQLGVAIGGLMSSARS